MKNLSIRSYSYNSLIEKILRDSRGQLVRATFCVYENGGRVKVRLLHVVAIDEAPAIENKTFTLPSFTSRPATKFYTFVQKAVVSPYFHTNLLYSLGSKPRAPSAPIR